MAEMGPTASGALCSVLACLSEGWKLGGLAAQLPCPGPVVPLIGSQSGPTLYYWRQHPCTDHATATCLHAVPSFPPSRYTLGGFRTCSWTAAACPSATAWWTQRSATAHSPGRRSWCQASTRATQSVVQCMPGCSRLLLKVHAVPHGCLNIPVHCRCRLQCCGGTAGRATRRPAGAAATTIRCPVSGIEALWREAPAAGTVAPTPGQAWRVGQHAGQRHLIASFLPASLQPTTASAASTAPVWSTMPTGWTRTRQVGLVGGRHGRHRWRLANAQPAAPCSLDFAVPPAMPPVLLCTVSSASAFKHARVAPAYPQSPLPCSSSCHNCTGLAHSQPATPSAFVLQPPQ